MLQRPVRTGIAQYGNGLLVAYRRLAHPQRPLDPLITIAITHCFQFPLKLQIQPQLRQQHSLNGIANKLGLDRRVVALRLGGIAPEGKALFDDKGAPLYPELMAQLDDMKADRIHCLMLRRDWSTRGPWPTWPDPKRRDATDLTHATRKVKEFTTAAGLWEELTFTSFRHGGATEGGDSGLTEKEQVAQGRWKSVKALSRYVKTTKKQVIAGTKKWRAQRLSGEAP